MPRPRVVIVTGLSGAGLSTAIHTLQDNGFYCIDNLPIELLWDTLALIDGAEITADKGYAFGMDIRNTQFAERFPKIKEELSNRVKLDVLFVRSEVDVLEERFGTARRRHPLARIAASLREQILQEDSLLKPVEQSADAILDTTHLKPHQLRRLIEERYSSHGQPLRTLQLVLVSFGFKHAPLWPIEGLHDVRFLQNPYFESKMREKTGLDKDVQDFVMKTPEATETFNKIRDLYRYCLPRYLAEGRHFLRVGIGCTGGQHRSVTFVEKLSQEFQQTPIPGVIVSVVHRDVQK
jgi:UPF0042 nucleotide-binding protein